MNHNMVIHELVCAHCIHSASFDSTLIVGNGQKITQRDMVQVIADMVSTVRHNLRVEMNGVRVGVLAVTMIDSVPYCAAHAGSVMERYVSNNYRR